MRGCQRECRRRCRSIVFLDTLMMVMMMMVMTHELELSCRNSRVTSRREDYVTRDTWSRRAGF